ncbi:MAG: tannase/feruloyl esterase family alpha/beta hydrolase [Chromatiales bacterium]|nr:tannase/feruloyl esterase family alpha/beta hydrolase [Chromatiales bacterium]
MMRLVVVLLGALAWGPSHAERVAPADAADRFACEALKAIDLSEATGASVRLTEVGMLAPAGDQPALCRVSGFIDPQVGFEVRMPVRDWNSKLLVTGCSNLCGILQIQGMEDALARGYAAATTDMGHRTGDTSDARWAWNNPALETDFGHRATHVTTLAAKELVANYYGNRPDYAYFRGCSTGGRQALVAAERYPEDYDGIIAGAPFNQSLSVPHMAWLLAANAGPDGEPLLERAEFELLGKAALAACDARDGAADGVISDPEACRFRPDALQCPAAGEAGAAPPACLTAAQVEAANRIYSGPRTSAGKTWSSGGSPVGSEFTWEKSLLAPPGKQPFFQFIVENWSRYLAYEPDPPMSSPLPVVDFDAGPGQFAATAAVAGFRPDLERFRSHGGRLLVYHGSVDESLMPAHTLDYWRQARKRLGADQLDEFARLFIVPGMLHCGGGPGAADIDYLSALERWVEADEVPASLLAHKVRDAVPTSVRQPRFPLAPATVEYTRRVYPWPQTAPLAAERDLNSSRLPVPAP